MQQVIAHPSTPRHPIAFRGTFHGVEGIALCDTHRRVHFLPDATGLWHQLTDADRPALDLNGRLDLIAAQRLADETHGSLIALAIYRNSHRPRLAA